MTVAYAVNGRISHITQNLWKNGPVPKHFITPAKHGPVANQQTTLLIGRVIEFGKALILISRTNSRRAFIIKPIQCRKYHLKQQLQGH